MASNTTDVITIQDTDSLPVAPASIASSLTSLVPMLLVVMVVYFLLIRPEGKRRQNQVKLISSVKSGEEVLTNSGIFGKISKINDSDNTVMLQVAKDVEIKISKNSIVDIINNTKKDKQQVEAEVTQKKLKKK